MKILLGSDFQIGAGRTLGITLEDQERWLDQIVDIAIEEKPGLFVGLGDAFQSRSTTRDQDEVFMRFLVSMSRQCRVLWVNGNHDWRGYERPSTTGIFREMGVDVALDPFVHRYHTPGDRVTVACLPWTAVGRLVASQDGGDRAAVNQQAAEHLVTIAAGLRAQIADDETAILAAHWMVSGAHLPTGLPVDQVGALVIELSDLVAQGWDAVALGDVHEPQVFHDDPPVFYCGSPYANDWGESDSRHGVMLLDTERLPERPRLIELDGPRLITLDMEAAQAIEITEAEWFGADVFGALVRLRVRATAEEARRLDVRILRREAEVAGARFVTVQLEIEKPERARVQGLDEELDELAALDLWMEASGVNGAQADAMRERTERYLGVVRA